MSRTRFAAELVSDPGSVLDIGCRAGELSRYVSGPYSGADLCPGPHVRYAGDITAIDIAERFDTVFALDILEHLEHPSAMFDRLVGLARKQVVVSLPNCYDLKSRWRFLRGGPLSGKYLFSATEPVDRHRWLMSRSEIHTFFRDKARQHGLSVEMHDMAYGSGGNRMGRWAARLLPPSLSVRTVVGVFKRNASAKPHRCERATSQRASRR